MRRLLLGTALCVAALSARAQQPYLPVGPPGHADAASDAIVGDALRTEGAYRSLVEISDRFGPRMAGTPGHAAAMGWLERELRAMGLAPRRERFAYQGWRRGADRVEVVAPFSRVLRAEALGYSAPTGPLEAELALYRPGQAEAAAHADYEGRVLLLPAGARLGSRDQDSLVERHGVRGFLATNRVDGGRLLARTARFEGGVAPVPLFAVTHEEGEWLRRLVEGGEVVRVRVSTTSAPEPMTGENLVATLPGTRPEGQRQRVVVGAHFDSWDLGQGALDNGLGVVQLLETARLLVRHVGALPHTVELVWFDAEELGLWGSRAYAERHAAPGTDSDLRLMVNLDMVGEPQGLNAMGFDALVPVLEEASQSLGAWSLGRPVANRTWLGSDHHPFVARGVPSVTFHAPIDPDAVSFYHDFGDTVDKVGRYHLARASAIVALLVRDLASGDVPGLRRLTALEAEHLLSEAGAEPALREMGWWPLSPPVESVGDGPGP
ncbi:M28 family metallopeptidase [Rubrivirga sp.]|uniref:M28 family metallopeptidase n=1 Tax=Rubrivirga sp. TaxID=1885344 RepID=UPI003B525FB9